MYNFTKIKQLSNFRYYSKQKYDKKSSTLYYTSYTSKAKDLNLATLAKIQRHKQIIDLAFKMVENQMRQGICSYATMIYPTNLTNDYKFYIYNTVAAKLKREERKAKNKIEDLKEKAFQPYWVYSKMIRCYEFRENKGLLSKFQCFVEFKSADSRDKTIKLNLAMSRKGYENRHTLYKDGFDLLLENNQVKVRHVSEEIVNLKKDNNIERHLVVDAWGNIYSATIDKNPDNLTESGLPRFNEDRKVVVSKLEIFRRSKKVENLLNYLDKHYSQNEANLFYNRMKVLDQSIQMKLASIIGSNEESKIQILVQQNPKDNIFKETSSSFLEGSQRLCAKRGIKLKVVFVTKEEIDSIVKKHKEDSNTYSEKHKGYGFVYKDINKTKWQEHLIASIKLAYKDFYPIFARAEKSLVKHSKNTDENGSQVPKPVYPTYEEHQKEFFKFFEDGTESECRANFVYTVKQIALKYYKELTGIDLTDNAIEEEEVVWV